MPFPEQRQDPHTFSHELVMSVEGVLYLYAEGKLDFDPLTHEARRTNPIGELLNDEMRQQLRGFIEKKRPLTKQILFQIFPKNS
jgi:hypothetical protein